MKKLFIFITILTISACSEYRENYQSAKLDPYVEYFTEKTGIIPNAAIFLADLKTSNDTENFGYNDINGEWYKRKGTFDIILIDIVYFEESQSNDEDFKIHLVVAHEILHSLLQNIEHFDDPKFDDGCYKSFLVAGTYKITQECWILHEDEMYAYLVEMYNSKK